MRVAAIQFKARKGRPDESLTALLALVERAGQGGARLIVCPEMALSGYLFPDPASLAPVAEPAPEGTLPALAELARRFSTYIVCGYPEVAHVDGQRRLYNSARVIGPDGALVYNYRKRLLFQSDTTWAASGDTPYPLVELPAAATGDGLAGRLTVGICMDLNDDRFIDFLRGERPRLLAFPTNWLDEGEDVLPYWQFRLLRTRCYFIAANTYGSEDAQGHPPTRFCGRSTVLAPGGRLLGRAPQHGDAVLLCDVPDPHADKRKEPTP